MAKEIDNEKSPRRYNLAAKSNFTWLLQDYSIVRGNKFLFSLCLSLNWKKGTIGYFKVGRNWDLFRFPRVYWDIAKSLSRSLEKWKIGSNWALANLFFLKLLQKLVSHPILVLYYIDGLAAPNVTGYLTLFYSISHSNFGSASYNPKVSLKHR